MGVMTTLSGAGQWLRSNLVGNDRNRDFLDNDGAKKHEEDLKKVELLVAAQSGDVQRGPAHTVPNRRT